MSSTLVTKPQTPNAHSTTFYVMILGCVQGQILPGCFHIFDQSSDTFCSLVGSFELRYGGKHAARVARVILGATPRDVR